MKELRKVSLSCTISSNNYQVIEAVDRGSETQLQLLDNYVPMYWTTLFIL